MCPQSHDSVLGYLCWLAVGAGALPRAVLLVGAATVLAFLIGALARLLRFFQMDPDDIRRAPQSEPVTHAPDAALTPDEPDA